MNISRTGVIDLSDVKYVEPKAGFEVLKGDVLFNNTNSPELIGKTAVCSLEASLAFSNHMTRLRMNKAADPKFFAYELHWLWMTGYFRHRCVNHVNQASISAGPLSETVPLFCPPVAEQRRIVAEIEKQFTRLAAAHTIVSATKKKVLALSEKIIGSIFEMTPEPEWRNLEVLIADGPQNGLYKPAHDYGKGVPIVRIDDISGRGDIRSRETLRFLSVTDEELRRYELRENDVLINRVNSMSHLGKSAVVPPSLCPAVFESNMMRLRLTPDIAPMWMTCYFNSRNGRRRLTTNAKQAVNQASINQKDVRKTSIPCPSIDVQGRKLEYLSEVDSIFRATVAAAELLTQRASRLRQSILAKAFSGQLVPQDPNDEPASVLLERIRAQRGTPGKQAVRRKRVDAQEELASQS